MIKVGITGEMGSGKSYCSKIFAELGVPVFNSDEEARRIQNTNQELKDKVIAEFGNVYLPDGRMDSIAVRKLVFGHSEDAQQNLKRLTSIVIPYVISAFQSFCESHSTAKYVLAESAILFESGFNSWFDSIIYVVADDKLRVAAAMLRDGISEEEYHHRMRNQMSPVAKKMGSKYIIQNDYTSGVVEQIKALHNKLSKC